jgi:adenine-specific DNA-methyltransferase
MSKKYEDLKELLLELFQLDQPDLDFGLYRVLAVRRDEIVRYLDRDLRGQVSAAFAGYRSADKTELEQQLQVAIGQAQQLGADPDSLPKVKELREKLRTQVVDVAGLEADVYNHLFRFFRRYYSEGDFLSKRVYKKDTYAIPYEGEEVMLH